MSFEKILKQIVEEIVDGTDEREEEIVGKVSFETLKMHQYFVEMEQDLIEDIKDRRKELDLQAKRTIKQEFSERIELIKDEHSQVWYKIFNELDIKDRTINYSIDKTGHVTTKVPKKNRLRVVKREINKDGQENGVIN